MEDRGQLEKEFCTTSHIVLEEVGNDKSCTTSHDVPQRPIYTRLLSAYTLDPASNLIGSHNISKWLIGKIHSTGRAPHKQPKL